MPEYEEIIDFIFEAENNDSKYTSNGNEMIINVVPYGTIYIYCNSDTIITKVSSDDAGDQHHNPVNFKCVKLSNTKNCYSSQYNITFNQNVENNINIKVSANYFVPIIKVNDLYFSMKKISELIVIVDSIHKRIVAIEDKVDRITIKLNS